VEEVIVRTLEEAPEGATHWSKRGLARTGISPTSVHRIWRPFGLQPHRTETFKIPPDPLLDEIRDVVGLYLAPPANAARLSEHAAADGSGAWIVSTPPARLFSRNQAITALTLAERRTCRRGYSPRAARIAA
jgi:hypothetical protein